MAQIPRMLGLDRKTMNVQRDLIRQNSKRYFRKYGETLEQAIQKGTVREDFMRMFEQQALRRSMEINRFNGWQGAALGRYYMAATQTQNVYEIMSQYDFDDWTKALAIMAGLYGFNLIFSTDMGRIALKGLGFDGASGTV